MNHIYNAYNNNKYKFDIEILKFYNNIYGKYGVKIENLNQIHRILEFLPNEKTKYYLDNKIPLFGINDRDSFLVNDFYKLFDTDYNFVLSYIQFLKDEIKPIFPQEDMIVVQKTPNIRFHLPGCSNIGKRDFDPSPSIIGLHKDSEFGHPSSEINIIIPITEMFESNSIYHEPYPNSDIEFEKYDNIKLLINQFYMGNLNQCRHYNRINETNLTRVSFDIRVIPGSKYYDNEDAVSVSKNLKFKIGNYYMIV